ncbi:MAG TPA: hypothetical protein VL463_31445, partial [Kofleriaceae bacterium]|nr:hypothetical protein [Kofleriaceae bacterium]
MIVSARPRVELDRDGRLVAERGTLSSPRDAFASGLELAAIAADELGAPIFKAARAPIAAQRKLVERIARVLHRAHGVRVASAAATVLLDVFEGTSDRGLRDESMYAYLALLSKTRVRPLRESMIANLDRVRAELDAAQKEALDRSWDAILPEAPPYASWFGSPKDDPHPTFRVVCQVQDVFFSAWRHEFRKLGFRSDGHATDDRITYVRDDRTTKIVVDYVKKGEGIFTAMHDPRVHAVMFLGHSDWWARVPRNLERAPDQRGDKLLVLIMCFGKHFFHALHARYPRAHIVTTKDPTEDPEDEALLEHVFAGISARASWAAIRRAADQDRTTEKNFIFPNDWRYIAGVIDEDRDGQLDRFDRFCNVGARKKLAGARSIEDSFVPDPVGMHPRGAELSPRELDGAPVFEAALMLNSLSYDNWWLDQINQDQHVVAGGWHAAAPGDTRCTRMAAATRDGDAIVRVSCSTRYARASQPALTAMVVYEGWWHLAGLVPARHRPAPLDRALMGVLLVAHALANSDYRRPDEVFHAFLRRWGFPAHLPYVDAVKTVEYDEDWESGSPKSVAKYREQIAPASLARLALAVTALGACGHAVAPASPDAPAIVSIDAPLLPDDTVPCDHPDAWPYALHSTAHPVTVHYRVPDERDMAEQVMGLVDHSWDVETGVLGFRPPIDDGAKCGPDGSFDVFLWRGHEECFVDVIAEHDATPWDDRAAYLVVDPWGPYGGAILDTTVAHELNHAMQAADDWDDSAIVYEMTSVFVEDQVYDDDNQYVDQIKDFQAHPEWSLDHDDQYETWYMYGSALYLRFVRDRYFNGDASFAGAMWMALRSPYGAGDPDFEDALDSLLKPKGTSFLGSIPEFERWRVYTGARDDGHHFEEGATFAEP